LITKTNNRPIIGRYRIIGW